MLRFRGSPALSVFRLERLLPRLREQVPAVTAIYAEFLHVVDLAGPLTSHDQEILTRLLTYGPPAPEHAPSGEPDLLVAPRPGTI